LAKKMGATRALNVSACKNADETAALIKETMKELGMTEGFDVGLEMSGFQIAISSMLETMNHGGRLSLLGLSGGRPISVNWDHLVFKGLTLKGIYGREMFETW